MDDAFPFSIFALCYSARRDLFAVRLRSTHVVLIRWTPALASPWGALADNFTDEDLQELRVPRGAIRVAKAEPGRWYDVVHARWLDQTAPETNDPWEGAA